MYFCPNCGKLSEQEVAFCSACGTAMKQQGIPTPPADTPPTYTPPVYTPPAYTPPPQTPVYTPVAEVVTNDSKAGLGKAIAGMAIAIAGLFFAVIGILAVISNMSYDPAESFGFAFAYSLFSLPLSIVGMCLGKGSIADGCTSAMASVGKKLGLAGMIVSFVMLFLGFIALIAMGSYYI